MTVVMTVVMVVRATVMTVERTVVMIVVVTMVIGCAAGDYGDDCVGAGAVLMVDDCGAVLLQTAVVMVSDCVRCDMLRTTHLILLIGTSGRTSLCQRTLHESTWDELTL